VIVAGYYKVNGKIKYSTKLVSIPYIPVDIPI